MPELQVEIKSEDESVFDSDASINFDYSSLSKKVEDDDLPHKYENTNYDNFPKKIIQDSKLLIRGKALVNLMSK